MTLGLLLSLEPTAPLDSLTDSLRAHPQIDVGECMGQWLPVAAEAGDDAGCRALHDWISTLPGVAYVDVVHVNFESAPEAAPASNSSTL